MSLVLPATIVALGVIVGTLPLWLPLPHPNAGLVDEVPPSKFAVAGNMTALCGTAEKLVKGGHRLFENIVVGSESVVADADGVLYAAAANGDVWAARPKGTKDYELGSKPVANVSPGRPLGLQFDNDGKLIICNFLQGLISLDVTTGKYKVLTNKVSQDSPLGAGSPIVAANDLAIAKDGTIYFSDSSEILKAINGTQLDTEAAFQLNFFKGGGSGRLLKYSPATGITVVLQEGIWFANGVALSADESFVSIVETPSLKVYKYWLKGPKTGEFEVLIDKLPGYPDGIASSEDGNFWVALIAPPLPGLPFVQGRLVRLLVAWLPDAVKPKPAHLGAILKVSPEGEVVDCLLDLHAVTVDSVSAVAEQDGRLFIGNLRGNYISYYDLRERKPKAADDSEA